MHADEVSLGIVRSENGELSSVGAYFGKLGLRNIIRFFRDKVEPVIKGRAKAGGMGFKNRASNFCSVWYSFLAQDKKYRGEIRCNYILSQNYCQLQTTG